MVKAEEAGKKIVLLAKKLGSIDIGSPIYYQGILTGEVLGYELGSDRKNVFVHAFVKAPYDKLIRGNTRFWNASGLDISISSDGVDVRTESVLSLLFGGIAFETPDTLEPVEQELEGLVFTLHDSYESIHEGSYTRKIRFVLFFDGSVRGLNIGAPVEFEGIKVGSVVNLHLEYDPRDASFKIPVVIEIELERVVVRGDGKAPPPSETLQILVSQGLRARLGTGSLLTGKLFVELLMRPDMPARFSSKQQPFSRHRFRPGGPNRRVHERFLLCAQGRPRDRGHHLFCGGRLSQRPGNQTVHWLRPQASLYPPGQFFHHPLGLLRSQGTPFQTPEPA